MTKQIKTYGSNGIFQSNYGPVKYTVKHLYNPVRQALKDVGDVFTTEEMVQQLGIPVSILNTSGRKIYASTYVNKNLERLTIEGFVFKNKIGGRNTIQWSLTQVVSLGPYLEYPILNKKKSPKTKKSFAKKPRLTQLEKDWTIFLREEKLLTFPEIKEFMDKNGIGTSRSVSAYNTLYWGYKNGAKTFADGHYKYCRPKFESLSSHSNKKVSLFGKLKQFIFRSGANGV